METKPKSLEEHRDYLYKIVKLKLFFLHLWLEQHPEESFSEAIRNRVDIYRKTNANPGLLTPAELFFDDAPWKSMENAACKIYQQTKHNRLLFELQAFEVFRKSIDDRCERDYSDFSPLQRFQCGCFRHETHITPEGNMGFHITNPLSPRSFLDDPLYVKDCFLYMLDIAEKIYGARTIGTSTWLNSNPRWLAFFPLEWKENLSEPNQAIQWHYGFWGQFLTARKTFNEKYGAILRATGNLPFLPRKSFCSITAMRKHLETIRG